MNSEKIIQCMMIFLSLQFYVAQSHDTVPSSQTTQLIEFVKKQEDHLVNLKKDKTTLMDRCIYDGSSYTGAHPYYYFYLKRSASSIDLKKLYNIHQQIFDKDGKVLKKQIADLLEQGESFNAVDTHNHTALYYAKSTNVYDALRSSGANFELIPFLYMYQWYTIPALTALFFLMYKLYEVGYFSFDRCIRYGHKVYDGTIATIDDIQKLMHGDVVIDKKVDSKKTVHDRRDMHSRDEFGRTHLMNYVIKQEATLVALRIKIDTLWTERAEWADYTEWDDYYSVIIQHKSICHQTQAHIKKMVELGADVNIQDASGKTLLDYCATKEIYETLLALGTDFQIDAWAYFNYDYFVKKAPIILPILATTFVMTTYMMVNKNTNLQDERDAWFERWAKRYL